ncbi:LysR family transcriptional regulator [Bradyrhizobium sp. 141]|uniref:LysR family transcriptional regulator n=1 Tax=Bradyrhizobium sp. 141 TaxID=2782617 RepID=UPI00320B3A5D
MDRQEAMNVFVSVVEEGDFSSAARGLRMTPSAISKIIGRLETSLGVRLLQRSTRRISLTAEGSTYADSARRILNDIKEAETQIQPGAEPRRRLRVSLPSAFGHRLIVPMLPAFIDRYPAIELELMFTDAFVDLVAEETDVAVRVAAHSDSRLVVRRLAPNRRVICASPPISKDMARRWCQPTFNAIPALASQRAAASISGSSMALTVCKACASAAR